ncbi:S8 family serine peptidase [uncultured Dokdonia sp.]|uniref:S8 family serine peptidase n=1 Tax=uncultured Dokdonia sp. TaxID=575653 RepID=UPI002631D7CC|nr:S8 family serine peptidase [uncultured Dokdonia sp.]
MRIYKFIMFLLCFMFCSLCIQAQNHRFYVRATSQNFNPSLTLVKGKLTYNGTDRGLKKVFDNNDIYVFERAFYNSTQSALLQTWYVESNSSDIHTQFLQFASHLFSFGEYNGQVGDDILAENGSNYYVSSNDKGNNNPPFASNQPISIFNTFYPDDYGATSPVINLGIDVGIPEFDFIGVPEAWYYTTGSPDIILGLSDAQILINNNGLTDDDPEFVDKTTTFYSLPGNLSTGNPHGYGVGMRMAGQGDNENGLAGVCYDCPIYAVGWGSSSFDSLLAVSNAGARVINCSWYNFSGFCETHEMVVNEIYNNGTIIVAAAANTWILPTPEVPQPYMYPASYDHVISVGGIGHKKEVPLIEDAVPDGNFYTIRNVKNYIGVKLWVDINETNPVEFINTTDINPTSASTRNDAIDINAPGGGMFSYGTYLRNVFNGDTDPNSAFIGEESFFTSPATPQVSGTIGLMLDLNQCLSFEEVESILKITSTYVGDLPAHQSSLWINRYGSGGLHTGRSVKLVNDLLDPTETAYLENQKFTRWDFEFKGVSEKIEIRNQEFTEGSTLNVVAKNRILIEEDSLLEPNSDGNALLVIDPALTIDTICDPPGFTDTTDPVEIRQAESIMYKVYPTKVTSIIALKKIGNTDHTISKVVVYDLFNRIVYSNDTLEDLKNNDIMEFDLSGLKRGIYIIKGYGVSNEEVVTEKIIKE